MCIEQFLMVVLVITVSVGITESHTVAAFIGTAKQNGGNTVSAGAQRRISFWISKNGSRAGADICSREDTGRGLPEKTF